MIIDETWIGRKVLYVTEDGKFLPATVYSLLGPYTSESGIAKLLVGAAAVTARYDANNKVADTFHLPPEEAKP